MLIDAHMHIWSPDRGDYGWLTPADTTLFREFDLDDYRAVAGDEIGAVLVQAAPTEAETDFLLASAAKNTSVLGIVGWADLDALDLAGWLDARVGPGRLVGIRPMLQDIPDPAWLDRPTLDGAFAAMELRGLAFDALIRPDGLPAVQRLARRHPDLRIVADHCAKPPIAARIWQPWADDLARLADCANVVCKLSGLVTECAAVDGPDAAEPYAAHAAAVFGGDRLLWGSDWPVCTARRSFAAELSAARDLAAHLSLDAERLFGANAARAYRLNVRNGRSWDA